MDNDDIASFQDELAHLTAAYPDPEELSLVRSALMWLSVTRRPLRAHELLVALRIEDSKDATLIERLLTDGRNTDDGKAATYLEGVLGHVVATTRVGDGEIRVALRDARMRGYLTELDHGRLAFSTAEAHLVVTGVCMVVCSVSGLHLAQVHDGERVSGLVLYAWSHWAGHLHLSGCTLGNDAAADLTDSMVFRVSVDLLVFLGALNYVVTGPITFPAELDRASCVGAVRHAQDALQGPMTLLTAIVSHGAKYSQNLQACRRMLELSRYPARRSGPRSNKYTATSSQAGVLVIDKLMADTAHLFGEMDKRIIQDFADLARGLRVLSLVLVRTPLYDELLREYDSWSPLDVLVNGANWAENIASYPFWDILSGPALSQALHITDRGDPNFHPADLVRHKIRNDGHRSHQQDESSVRRVPASEPTRPPPGISRARWTAARAIYALGDSLPWTKRRTTITLNDPHFLVRRTSSFASFPPQLHRPSNPLRHLRPLIPPAMADLYNQHLTTFLARFNTTSPLTAPLTTAYHPLKTTLLSQGYRPALLTLSTAILLHHLRRLLLPSFAVYIWHTPLSSLRIALSNPDYFLTSHLCLSWPHLILAYLQKPLLDLVAPHLHPILYLTHLFATLEYTFSRSIYATAFSFATYRLLTRSRNHRLALLHVIATHWTKIPPVAYQTYRTIVHGLAPLMVRSITHTLEGQPGLLVLAMSVMSGVTVLLKYRSTFFIAMEISDMFVAMGLFVIGSVLLGRELVMDPLGLVASTEEARRRGVRARSALPPGASDRGRILRGR
ncbi:hypothetical protein OQA88_8335 [Cercophora sp. LCS_1]